MGAGCEQCQDGEVLDTGPGDTKTDAADLFQSYRWLRDYHVMPQAGGMVAQSARFIAAVDFIDLAASRGREKRAEICEKKEKIEKDLRDRIGVRHV